jgi:hypothetical protein
METTKTILFLLDVIDDDPKYREKQTNIWSQVIAEAKQFQSSNKNLTYIERFVTNKQHVINNMIEDFPHMVKDYTQGTTYLIFAGTNLKENKHFLNTLDEAGISTNVIFIDTFGKKQQMQPFNFSETMEKKDIA